jgi:tripartite-type tricarboxylate transporter receptor subunit TctC
LASAAGAAATAAAVPARAQAWPNKPVRLVVPFGPGGPADVYARQLGQELGEQLKQQFVIDNRPGAGAVVGTDIVAKAPPDGYTLLMMSNAHTTNETLLASRPYVLMRDLVGVAPVNSSDLAIVVDPKLPAKTLREFIALAKAEPGKLAYASSGPGTPYHMAGELFKAMSGTDILHVPHRNSADARNAVIGGHVQMMIDAVTAMKGHIDAGHRRRTLGGAARRADGQRGGRAGLRGDDLAGRHGAGRHAGRHRRPAERRDRPHHRAAGDP